MLRTKITLKSSFLKLEMKSSLIQDSCYYYYQTFQMARAQVAQWVR